MKKRKNKRNGKFSKFFLKYLLTFYLTLYIISLALRVMQNFNTEKRTKEYAPLAQLVEHLTLNQGVQGSNP